MLNTNEQFIVFSARIQAMESIWVIGEDFVEGSACRCFSQVTDQQLFTHTKFDIKIFSSKSFNSCFLTTVARVRNTLAMALLEVVTPLPKLLFIMLEDDIIKELRKSHNGTIQYLIEADQQGLIHVLGRNIEWLFHEIRKLLAGHNDALPPKARRDVNIIWVLPTRHMNYQNDQLREIMATCIETLVEIHNVRNFALPLKQNWDQFDPSIFFFDSQRFSNDGLNRLWRAFDRTVWYANVMVNKMVQRKLNDNGQGTSNVRGNPQGAVRGTTRGGRGYFGRKRFYTKFGKKLPPPPPEN